MNEIILIAIATVAGGALAAWMAVATHCAEKTETKRAAVRLGDGRSPPSATIHQP